MGSSPQPPDRNEPKSQKSEAGPESPAVPDAGLEADYVDGVPTFDFVRDRIEGRYATALGSTELAEESAAGRSVAQQQEDRDAAARERLEQIRKSLDRDQ
jgi:phage shock protein A